MHTAPFLDYLHTFQRRAMRKDRSIQNKYMNTGNSAILFFADTCLVGYAKRQVKTTSYDKIHVRNGERTILSSFFDLFAYFSATCDAQGQVDSKQVHEYRKLRNSILSGYLPGGICEATHVHDDVMMTTYMYEAVHAQYCRMV